MTNKLTEKIPMRIIFLIAMVLLYAVTFIFNRAFVMNSLSSFLNLLKEIYWIIIIVYFVVFLTNLFLKDSMIKKHLGKESGFKGWVWAMVTGVLIPSPPYIVFPLLGEMQKKGMRNALIISFLYSRNLQITFLPVMAYYFGIKFTIVASVYIFIFSIASGVFLEKLI
jgi:uncharacterized membrane protein YraQ (UPF0718 family)